MKNLFYNSGYFIKEATLIFKLNLMSNISSIFSTGFMFFLLLMVVSGWWTSSRIVEMIQRESEISVYYKDGTGKETVMQVIQNINALEGVREARLVDEDEAYGRMVEILGKEASVLKYLDENPFNPFIEVKIHVDKMDSVLANLETVSQVEHIRDNREVLNRLKSLTGVLKLIGYFIMIAVSVSTLFIISHIIRLGVYNNREQISTLRLLGAPEHFIAFPFLLEGLTLTLGGSILSLMLAISMILSLSSRIAVPLPFIPLPPLGQMISGIILLITMLSTLLGIGGSLLGISSAK